MNKRRLSNFLFWRYPLQILGYVYTGTLERFYLEPFRVGTDRLPVYMMSWNRSVQKVNILVEKIVAENIVVENCPF